MRTILKISTILTWFNLVMWGLIVLTGLLMALLMQQMVFLIGTFLICANLLHSYAAMQLHKSIKDPAKPLSNQTPVGIRFIGMIAAFLGIVYFAYGMAVLQNPHEAQQIMETQFQQTRGGGLAGTVVVGSLSILLGICLIANVLMNFRLLRWYHFMKGIM